MNPPLAIDIDGTMSREDRSIEGRIFDALRSWDGTIVVATGKAVPYPIALCEYIGIDILVVAENGGVIVHNNDLIPTYDLSPLRDFDKAFRGDGHDYGWPGSDLVNRWRQTEIAASHSVSLDLLKKYASQFDLSVVDSNYAYHIGPSGVDKGVGLRVISKRLGLNPMDWAIMGNPEVAPNFGGSADHAPDPRRNPAPDPAHVGARRRRRVQDLAGAVGRRD